jgi:hypothetical protein
LANGGWLESGQTIGQHIGAHAEAYANESRVRIEGGQHPKHGLHFAISALKMSRWFKFILFYFK